MPNYADRRGMTLVELLIVAVLGVFVLGAVYQVLMTNQRTYAAQNASVQGQQTIRGGMEVLFSELREISPADGDLLSIGATEMTFRANRAAAIVCDILTVSGVGVDYTVRVRRLGRFLKAGPARVFVENSPDDSSDDVWVGATIAAVDSTAALPCTTGGGVPERVELDGVTHDASTQILKGALVRNVVTHQYGVGTYSGETYLIRTDEAGIQTPLVGPINPTNGITFRYLDETGTVTADPTAVRQIEVTLRTLSNIRDIDGDLEQDSLTSRIYTRN